MRTSVTIGLMAVLAACGAPKSEDEETAPAIPAQLTFEGGDYKDNAAKLAHGKRLATVLDCTGCHGDNLQGTNATADDPDYGEMNAPNITLWLAHYSDADLDQLIRHGRPKDGREFWYMPVESFQFLSDADFAALIAYLRTFAPEGEQLPPIKKGKGFHEDIARGFGNAQQQVARYSREEPPDMGAQYEWGRHLARTVCTPCHNSQLQGYEGFAPNLDLAGAFSPEELETLLATGKGKSKPDLGMMKEIALRSLSKMTPRERQAVVAYVKARADRPQPTQ